MKVFTFCSNLRYLSMSESADRMNATELKRARFEDEAID